MTFEFWFDHDTIFSECNGNIMYHDMLCTWIWEKETQQIENTKKNKKIKMQGSMTYHENLVDVE